MRNTLIKKTVILFFIFTLFMVACTRQEARSPFAAAGFTMETVSLDSPFIDNKTGKEIHILYINDVHLQVLNDEVKESEQENIKGRIEAFSSNGTTTYEKWQMLPDLINEYNPDYVIFGGDIVDFNSRANTEAIKEGLAKIKAPYMYIRSDHDRYPYWLEDEDNYKATDRQDAVCDNSKVLVGEVGDVVILGMNPSDQDILPGPVEEAREILSKPGKTFIIATHIPFEEEVPGELEEFTMEHRGSLTYWGKNAKQVPNEVTNSFLEILYNLDTPYLIPAAHLHESFETRFSEYGIEHVFTPVFMGSIGEIIVY